MSYKSDRYFRPWGYTVSHSFLLLRSYMSFPDIEGYSEATSYNIDIEFIGVDYFDIPYHMHGIQIRRLVDNIPEKFRCYLDKSRCNKVFEIKSGENTYYLVAAGYTVAKNYWEDDDRVLNPSLKYDEIITDSDEDNGLSEE